MGIAEAPTGDGEVIGVRATLHPDLGAILDDHVGRAEGIPVRDVDTFGVRRRDARRRRLHNVGARKAAVVAGERHRAATCRTGDVTVDAHRARASDVGGHRQVGVGVGDLQGRASGHVDRRVGGQDGGAAEFQRAGGEEGAAGVRVGTGQDEVTRTGLVEADEAEARRAVGEGTGIGGFDRIGEVRHARGVGQGVGDGRRIGALGDLDEVLAEAVQVDRSGAVDAELDFRGRQDGIVLAEAKGAFAHVEQGVTRARAGRIEEDGTLADRGLGRTRDEVAGQGEVTRRHRAGIVDGRDEVTARGDTRIEGDVARDRGDIGGRAQHDDARTADVTGREAVDHDVVGYRDTVAQLEAGAAVAVGARLGGQRDGTAREAEGVDDLHVAFVDHQVAGHIVVDQGGQDEATVTSLRQVGGARDGHGRGVGTTRTDVEGDFASHRDGRAGTDGRGRSGGQRGAGQQVDRAGEAEGVDAATEFQRGARLDGDHARQGRAGQDLCAAEDAELTLGDREVTFGDAWAIDGDGVGADLGEREARQFEGAEAADIPTLRTTDGSIRGQREGLDGVVLREVGVVDDGTGVANARPGDGHRTAEEVDAVGDHGPGEVEGGAGRHGDGLHRRTEGTVAVDAERTAIDAGRTGIGVDGGENKETRTALREVRGGGDDAREGQRIAADVDGREAEGATEGDDLVGRDGQRTGTADRRGQRDVAVVVQVQDRTRAQRDEAGVVDDRSGERGVVAEGDAGRSERTGAGDGGRTRLEGEGTGGRQGGGGEAARGLREAGRGEAAGERGRTRVGEGTGGNQVGRTEGTRAEGDDTGVDRTRRGERAGSGQVTTRGERADREGTTGINGAGHGEGLAGLRREDAVGTHGQGSGRGGRGIQHAAVDRGGAQGERGRTGQIQGRALGNGRGRGDGEGIRCRQGAGGDGQVREAHGAREGRGAGVVLEEVARTTDVIDDRAIDLLDDEHRAGVQGEGARAERAAVDELEAATGDVRTTRVGVSEVDREDAGTRLVETRIHRDVRQGDGGNRAGKGVGGDVDDDQRVRRGVDELQVVEGRDGIDFGRERPGADGTLPARGIQGELVRQETSAGGGVVLQERPAVAEVRVEDRGSAAAGQGFIEGEELHGDRRGAEREDGIHDEAVALGQAAGVGGFELDDGARRQVQRVEANGAEASAWAEDTARGDVDRAGRGRTRAAIGGAGGHVDRARAKRAGVFEDGAGVDVDRADGRSGRTGVGERAGGEDGLGDGAGARDRATEQAKVRQGTRAGRGTARHGQAASHVAGVGDGAGLEQGVGRNRTGIGERTTGDLDGLTEADLGDVGAGVVREGTGVEGDVAAEATGVDDGGTVDDGGRIDRARVAEGRTRQGIDRTGGGDDAGRGSFERTRGHRGRPRVGVHATEDPAARAGLQDRGRTRIIADDEVDRVVARVRTREGQRTGTGFAVVVDGASVAELQAGGGERTRGVDDAALVADREATVGRLGARSRVLQRAAIEAEVIRGTRGAALTDRGSGVDVRELGDVQPTAVLDRRTTSVVVRGGEDGRGAGSRGDRAAHDEHRSVTGPLGEDTSGGEHEVAGPIKIQVATGLDGRDGPCEGQRGSRKGTHVGGTAAGGHRDGTGERVVARKRRDQTVGRDGCTVGTLARSRDVVRDVDAAFELNLLLERTATGNEGNATGAQATAMRDLGDAAVVSRTACGVGGIDGEGGEGVVGRQDHRANRGFAGEAREGGVTGDGRGDREDDARLSRNARSRRQRDAAVRVRRERLEGRERTAIELDVVGDRAGEGRAEGAVAVGLHRAGGDDGVTRVGIDAGKAEEGRDTAGAHAVDRAVLAEVGARLDEVGGAGDDAGEGDAVREARGARSGRGRRVEGDLRGGGAIEEHIARPGLRAVTVVADRRTSLERQRSTEGDEVTVGREDGRILDGDAVGRGAVDVFEGEFTGGDVVRHVGTIGADIDHTRADLGEGEAVTADRAVVAEAFHAADVEAALAVADAGIRRKRDVADARIGVGRRRAGIDDCTEATDAGAGDGEVDVVSALVGGRQGAAVHVVSGASDDFDGVTTTDSGIRTQTERAGLDLGAAREAVHAREDEDAGTGLDEADGSADAFLDVRGEGIGVRSDAAQADRDHGGGAAGVDDDAGGGGAADATTGQAVAVEVEGAARHDEFTGVSAERGVRGGGVGQETDGAAVDDGLTRIGVRTGQGEDAHAGLLHVAFADDLVGEGDVVDAVDREGRAGGDGDVALDRTDGRTVAELEGAAFDEGRTREGLGQGVDEAARTRVGVGGGDAVGTRADLAEDELARAAVGVVDERATELVRGVVAADRQDGRRTGSVVEDRADDVRGGGDGAGKGLAAAVHVEVAAIEVDEGVVVDLVVARTGEADRRAGVDGAVVAEGVDAGSGLRRQDQGAGIDHHPEVGVVEDTTEGERARTVLGDDEGARAGDAVEVDVAGAADGEAVGSLREGTRHVRRGGGAAVDQRALAVDAEAGDGEGLGNRLTVQVEGGTRVDRGRTRGRTERARVGEAKHVTRIDRGRASVVIETGQDDRAERTSGAHVEGVGTSEDGVDRQGRAAATEAVTAGARREGGRQGVQRNRRHRADHQRRVDRHRDGLVGVGREGQRTGGGRGQLVRGQPSGDARVGTGGDERTRSVQSDGGRGRRTSRGDFEDARADGGRAGVGVGAGQHDAAIETLVGDGAGAGREVTDEEVRGDGVDVGEDGRDGQLRAATTEEVTVGARGNGARVDGIDGGTEAQAVVVRGHAEEGAAREVDVLRGVAGQGERADGSARYDLARVQPGGRTGMHARGDQRTALQDFDGARARGEGAREAGQALLDRDDRRTRHVDVTAEGDVATGVATALDADVQGTHQAGDGVRDGDGVGTREGHLTAVDEDGRGGTERTGDGFGAVVEVRLDEVTADVEDAVIDAVGTAEGVVAEDVEVGTAILHDHARTRDRTEVTDIARLAHRRVAINGEVAVPAQDTGLVFEVGAVVQADDGVVARGEVPGQEGSPAIDVDRLAAEITEGCARLEGERTTGDLDVTRVDDRVVADDDQLAGAGLGQRIAGHVERRCRAGLRDAHAARAADARVAGEAEVDDLQVAGGGGTVDCAEVARAEARGDEELAARGGVAAGDVERGTRKDGHAAAVDAQGGVGAEPEDALLDAPGGEAGVGGAVEGVDAHARLDDEAVADDARGVGGVFEAFDTQRTRAVHAEAAGLPVAVTAQVDGEGTFVDVGRAGDVVGLDRDGCEALETGTEFLDGDLIAGLGAEEAAEGEVVTGLRVDHEASVEGRSGVHLLDDRQLVVQSRDEAAHDLRRPHQVELGVVEAVVEGDDRVLRDLLATRGRTTGVFGEVQGHVGQAFTEGDAVAERRREVRVVGDRGGGERAAADREAGAREGGRAAEQDRSGEVGAIDGQVVARDGAEEDHGRTRSGADRGRRGEGDTAVGGQGETRGRIETATGEGDGVGGRSGRDRPQGEVVGDGQGAAVDDGLAGVRADAGQGQGAGARLGEATETGEDARVGRRDVVAADGELDAGRSTRGVREREGAGTLEAGGRGGGQRAEGQRAEVARREVQRAAGERGAVTEHQGTSGDSGIARIGRRRIELDGAEARLVQGVTAGDRARDGQRGAGRRVDDGVRPEQNAAVGIQGERGRRGQTATLEVKRVGGDDRGGAEDGVGRHLDGAAVDIGLAGVAADAGEHQGAGAGLDEADDGAAVVRDRRGDGERRTGVLLVDEEFVAARGEAAAGEAGGRRRDGGGHEDRTGLQRGRAGQGQGDVRGRVEAEGIGGDAGGHVGGGEHIDIRARSEGGDVSGIGQGDHAVTVVRGEGTGAVGQPATEDAVDVGVAGGEGGVRAGIETKGRARGAGQATHVQEDRAVTRTGGERQDAVGRSEADAGEGLRIDGRFAALDEDRRAVQRERAVRDQDIVDGREGVTAIFGVLRIGAAPDGREVERQAAVEDAGAADVSVGRTEREDAETGLGQAAIRHVGREGGRGHQRRTVAAGDHDGRGRGVTRAWVGDGHARDLTRGLVEDRHRGGAGAAAADEADQGSAEVARARGTQGDRADTRARGTRQDGLDADGKAVGVDREATAVDGRGPDAAINEVVLGRGGAEGGVVDVDEGDAVGGIGVDLVEFDQATVGDVEDRERPRRVGRRVHQVELGGIAAEELTRAGHIELELAVRDARLVVGLVLVEVGQGELTAHHIDQGLLLGDGAAVGGEPRADGDVARTELEDAIAAEVAADTDFREERRVQGRGRVVDQDITVAAGGLTNREGGDIAPADQLQGTLQVKGAGGVVVLTEGHGIAAEGGIGRSDVDDRRATDTDADTVLTDRHAATEVLDGAIIPDGQSRGAARGFGEVEITRIGDADHLQTRVVRDFDHRPGSGQALAGVEARAEVEGVGDGVAREEQRVGGRRRETASADGEPSTDVQDAAALADHGGLDLDAARAAVGIADDEFARTADVIGSRATAIEDHGAFLDRDGAPSEITGEVRIGDDGAGTEVIRARAVDDDRTRAELDQLGGLTGTTQVIREGEVGRTRIDEGRTGDDVRDATDGEVAVEGQGRAVRVGDAREIEAAGRGRPIDASRGGQRQGTAAHVDLTRVGRGRAREDDLARSAARRDGTGDGQALGLREAVTREGQGTRTAAEAVTEATRREGTRVGDVTVGTERQVREVGEADGFGRVGGQGQGTRGVASDAAAVEPAHRGGVIARDGQGAATLQDQLVERGEGADAQGQGAAVDEDLVLVRDRGTGKGADAGEGLVTRALLGQGEAGRLEDQFGESRPGRRGGKGDGLGDFVDRGDGGAVVHAGAEHGHAGDDAGDIGHGHGRGRREGTVAGHARRTAEHARVGGILEAVAQRQGVDHRRDSRPIGQDERTVAGEATQGGGGEGTEREEAGVAVAHDDGGVLQGERIVEDQLTTRDAGLTIVGVRAVAQREVGRTGFRERQCPEASR